MLLFSFMYLCFFIELFVHFVCSSFILLVNLFWSSYTLVVPFLYVFMCSVYIHVILHVCMYFHILFCTLMLFYILWSNLYTLTNFYVFLSNFMYFHVIVYTFINFLFTFSWFYILCSLFPSTSFQILFMYDFLILCVLSKKIVLLICTSIWY